MTATPAVSSAILMRLLSRIAPTLPCRAVDRMHSKPLWDDGVQVHCWKVDRGGGVGHDSLEARIFCQAHPHVSDREIHLSPTSFVSCWRGLASSVPELAKNSTSTSCGCSCDGWVRSPSCSHRRGSCSASHSCSLFTCLALSLNGRSSMPVPEFLVCEPD
ncbi:hypothetical protein BDZ85DRAFT_83826 [Elsinoe ampelina]|uniref:Uncharacterized protein n=1 Tax=Elsinoe ampelina TaxID=302913 RepID=A0A6A6GGL7_9PEZI|nr:hypothetical protein BDZ85DRAFT_83826 [Elsinoe ampelina]